MELQRCRTEGWQHRMGFMNPIVINEENVQLRYHATCVNMFNALDKQHYKPYIFLPYNFEVWRKFVKKYRGQDEWKDELIVRMDFSMMQIKNEVLHVDTIDAVSDQLIGFIMREILDPKVKIYHDGPIN
ncbi:hypothetical protein C2845_PM16G03820 [Panicum miliaceum]|uniref:Uncharacterized protein n=1 Tax=Panicum miliaceum TaxID=4540 RepID=A0A3L6PV81_PANMI|nr:hypothetical protein C2845_PM16G03820 [Panicum miliaceum]